MKGKNKGKPIAVAVIHPYQGLASLGVRWLRAEFQVTTILVRTATPVKLLPVVSCADSEGARIKWNVVGRDNKRLGVEGDCLDLALPNFGVTHEAPKIKLRGIEIFLGDISRRMLPTRAIHEHISKLLRRHALLRPWIYTLSRLRPTLLCCNHD